MMRKTSSAARRGKLAIVGRLVVAAAALITLAGCDDEACIVWTKAEGACPSREEAIDYFVPAGCIGQISSVDSDGDFVEDSEDQVAGDLCCYSVTKSSSEFFGCEGGGFE